MPLPNASPFAILKVVIMMEKCTLELISTYHFGSSLKYLKNSTLKDFMNMLTLKTDRGSMSYIGGQIVLC